MQNDRPVFWGEVRPVFARQFLADIHETTRAMKGDRRNDPSIVLHSSAQNRGRSTVDDLLAINIAKSEFREAYNTADSERLVASTPSPEGRIR